MTQIQNKRKYTPGNDFYLYVNHEWLNDTKNSIPDTYSSWGGFTKLHDDILNTQISLVKELETKSELNEEEVKVYAVWKASQQRFNSWKIKTTTYNPIIDEFKILEKLLGKYLQLPDLSLIKQNEYNNSLAEYLHYTQINGISNILDFDSGNDLKFSDNIVLDLSVSGLSLPSKEYYIETIFSNKLELFKKHLKNVELIIQKNTDIKLSTTFINDIIEFETEIAKFSMNSEQAREYDKYFTNTTLKDVYKKINSLNSLEKKELNYLESERNFKLDSTMITNAEIFFEALYSNFNFREILSENVDKFFKTNKNKPNKEHITVYDGDSLRRCLNLILNINNIKKYYSYLQYQIICSVHAFCTQEIDDEFFDFYQRKLAGKSKQENNEKRSINIVNIYAGELLGKLFVKKYFPEKSKTIIKSMIDIIINVMEDSIRNNDWMTSKTKMQALAKLKNFTSKIGYPDVWKDYSKLEINLHDNLYQISKKVKEWNLDTNFFKKINSIVDENEWKITPQTVNAYFMPPLNEVVFSAAILQPPFYHQDISTIDFDISEESELLEDKDIITSVNYGSIGAVIAHEITHGYDDQGRIYDLNGNLNDWWCKKDEELFVLKTELLINSVEKYQYIDGKKNIHKINPLLTMGENLADLGGLSLSLKALLQYIEKSSIDELSKKNCIRLFFKSWANSWKQNIKEEKRIMLLKTDPHSPCDFRGNLVKHIDEFYKVFNINRYDKMFLEPEYRLKMW